MNYLRIPLTVIIVLLVGIFIANGQNNDDEDCWCKHQGYKPGNGSYAVFNIDTLVVNGNPNKPFYRFVSACEDGEHCNEGTCQYQIKRCRWVDGVQVCTWDDFTGECATGPIGGGYPWDDPATEEGDCQCIDVTTESDFSLVFTNITRLAEKYPDIYVMMEECNEDCDNLCQYLQIINGNATLKQGFCTNKWAPAPDDKDALPAPRMASELMDGNTTTDFDISLYPNPANDQVVTTALHHREQPIEIKLYDLNGRLIYSKQALSPTMVVDIEELHVGVYVLTANEGERKVRKRLVKN